MFVGSGPHTENTGEVQIVFTNASDMTQTMDKSPWKTSVKCLYSKMPVRLVFIVYVERSTDAAANEKEGKERETPDVL